MGETTAIIEGIDAALGELDCHCAADCTVPWACDACCVAKAKSWLAHARLGLYLPEVMVALEPEEQADVEKRVRLHVIDGFRK